MFDLERILSNLLFLIDETTIGSVKSIQIDDSTSLSIDYKFENSLYMRPYIDTDLTVHTPSLGQKILVPSELDLDLTADLHLSGDKIINIQKSSIVRSDIPEDMTINQFPICSNLLAWNKSNLFVFINGEPEIYIIEGEFEPGTYNFVDLQTIVIKRPFSKTTSKIIKPIEILGLKTKDIIE